MATAKTKQDLAGRGGTMAIYETPEPYEVAVTKPDYTTLHYDYTQVDAQYRTRVQDAAVEILAAGKRAKESIITMGERLIEVKALLPEWTFTAWLTAEFELSDRMAQNMMNVARQYGERPEIISVLNDTVLYLLAAPSTPESAREEVEAMAVAEGKSPQVATVKRVVKAHKPAPEPMPEPSAEEIVEEELAAIVEVAQEREEEEQQRLDINNAQPVARSPDWVVITLSRHAPTSADFGSSLRVATRDQLREALANLSTADRYVDEKKERIQTRLRELVLEEARAATARVRPIPASEPLPVPVEDIERIMHYYELGKGHEREGIQLLRRVQRWLDSLAKGQP